MQPRTKYPILLLALILITSCQSYKKIPYLQGLDSLKVTATDTIPHEVTIMPNDMLSIVVSCANPELAAPFNLIVQTPLNINQNTNQLTAQPTLQQYLVDKDGNIDFPVIGKLHVSGLTKSAIENLIKTKLKAYLKEDPIVTIRLSNFKVSVIGEVNSPGSFTINNNEKVNIFEALAMAKDMTIYGLRENVHIIREDSKGHKEVKKLDLTRADILESPYYYLQQNDIVYVTPNKAKSTTADITSSTTIWFSIIGSLMSFASIMIALFR
jgi:polysaccharide export outer membrane protein